MFKRASFRRGSSSSGPPAQEDASASGSSPAAQQQQQQQQASTSSAGSLLSRFKSAPKVPLTAKSSTPATTGASPSRPPSAGPATSTRGTSPSPAASSVNGAPPSPTSSAAADAPVYASGGVGPGRRSRANTLPTMVESGYSRPVSVSSSRSSFTSVSSVAADDDDGDDHVGAGSDGAARGRRASNGIGRNGHGKPGGGVWAEEEEEGRRPLVELASDDDDDHQDEKHDRVGQGWPGSALAGSSARAAPLTSALVTAPAAVPNDHQQSNGIENGQHAVLILGLDDANGGEPSSSSPSTPIPNAPLQTNGSPARPPLPSSVSEQPTVHHSPAADITSSPAAAPAAPPASKPPHTHHHAHHHTPSAAHAHSPPVASPPPIRAATLSGLKDVASIAAASLHAKELAAQQAAAANGGKKKKMGGGFMSSFSKKLRDPSLEGAMALASLPKAVQPAEELTPQLRMERAKQAERAHLLQICMELGVEIYDIAPDGHCMYAAVADQLHILKVLKEEDNNPRTTRAAAADYMLAHPDAFLPFLVGSADLEFGEEDDGAVEGETEAERFERRRAVEDGMMSERAFRRYCDRVRESGEWGGEPEILALSRYYQMPIHVIQSNHPKIVVHSPDPKAKATLDPKSARKIKAVRISYHRRLYGLGEHYNSLRKITYTLSAFSAMVPM